MLRYSVIIPVHNEQESLAVLIEELLRVMDALADGYECIIVDDCSSDRSAEVIASYQRAHREKIKSITLPARSGQTRALKMGIAVAAGDIVITLDGDLQNNPTDIPRLLAVLAGGNDCVCGWRRSRQDTWAKTQLSKCANVIQRIITGLCIHDVSCTLRVYTKQCAQRIPLNWEGQHRFIPLCLALQGLRIDEVEVHHRMRQYGKSKYSHRRIGKVVVDFFRVVATKGCA